MKDQIRRGAVDGLGTGLESMSAFRYEPGELPAALYLSAKRDIGLINCVPRV